MTDRSWTQSTADQSGADAVVDAAVPRPGISEANTSALRLPLTCVKCGHVTPYLEGWMMAAAMHHISAVHGRDPATLEPY